VTKTAPITANHTRLSSKTLGRAADVLALCVIVPEAEGMEAELELDDDNEDVEEVIMNRELLLDKMGELDEVELRDVVELEPENGGGTTLLVSTSWPTPQGISSPEGCLSLAGRVKSPLSDMMLKRVVQVLTLV